MTMQGVLDSVAAQVNAGALGPGVTASVRHGVNGHGMRHESSTVKQLPESLLDSFRQFRGDTDRTYFGLGDAVDAAVVELAGRVSANRIYKAAALETEYSKSEIRLLHETARATPQSLRDEFDAYPLVHQHYRTVRYLDPDKQRYYIRWAIESADAFGGRIAPASVLDKKIKKEMGIQPPEPTFLELVARALSAVERARDACEDARRHDDLAKMADKLGGWA